MDATVREIGEVVVAELRSAAYMASTIGQYEKTIRALAKYTEERGGAYSPRLGAEFSAMTISPRTGRFSAERRFDYQRLVGLFDSYARSGRVDLSVRKRGGGGPHPASGEFAAQDAAREAEMDDRGLAPATRTAYGQMTRSYLVFLEQGGSVASRTLTAPVFWRSWSPCWGGGRGRRCSGWCRTSARS